jgi:hypothetical protein
MLKWQVLNLWDKYYKNKDQNTLGEYKRKIKMVKSTSDSFLKYKVDSTFRLTYMLILHHIVMRL